MTLLATGLGGAAGGAVVCFGLVVFQVVVAFSLVGIRVGDRLRRRDSARARRVGTTLVAVCCVLPFAVYFGPSLYTRATLGRFPLGHYPDGLIAHGMTRDDVQARLGLPDERYERDGDESWYYYIGSLGASYFGVRFGPDGRVTGTWGD